MFLLHIISIVCFSTHLLEKINHKTRVTFVRNFSHVYLQINLQIDTIMNGATNLTKRCLFLMVKLLLIKMKLKQTQQIRFQLQFSRVPQKQHKIKH